MKTPLHMTMIRRAVPYDLPEDATEQGHYVTFWQRTGRHLDEFYAAFRHAGKSFHITSPRFRRDGGPHDGYDMRSARFEIAFAVAHAIESSLAQADQT